MRAVSNTLKNQRVLVIFSKAPILGQVKSRLARHIGPEEALRVHIQLLHRTLRRLCVSNNWSTELWIEGNLDYLNEVAFVEDYGVALRPQTGSDLGQRMYRAIEALNAQGKTVVLVGSDCPTLETGYIERAFSLVESGVDVVFGPAEDGGYVLIGMAAPHEGVFENITWGTAQVMQQSLDRITQLGLGYKLLETQWDVDNLQDLSRFESEFGSDDS